ncbi:septal ring lytic transglycosylase RlpA family protein [Rhizobium puerariae]|uniref:Endolytic peptidoglycan transglycosylase RlpA n=1 Tax=Rhizobium puerariae TaxID=1585791 RepID=A0ABV6AJL6_9HYPH
MKWLGVTLVCFGMASCATTEAPKKKSRSKEYFSEKEYGVKASPRVVGDGQAIPKGGGRFMVGQPYQVKGQTYVPKEDPNYNKNGLASWYGSAFHGRLTANGEVYDSEHLSAAHPTFPLPSYARVTNLETGSSVIVRVNDRGPYHPGRILDVSEKTAEMLDIKRTGTAKVNVQYVGRARMDGQDTPFLMASYIRKGDRLPSIRPEGQIATGVMVASNQPLGDQLQSYGSSMPQPVVQAGRVPAGAKPVSSGKPASAAQNNVAAASQAAPKPNDRPGTAEVRQPAKMVAAAAYPAPQPRQAAPAQQPARMASDIRPIEPQARQPQPQTTATAYAGEQRAKEPVVIFGNMVLQNPTPGQKPVR